MRVSNFSCIFVFEVSLSFPIPQETHKRRRSKINRNWFNPKVPHSKMSDVLNASEDIN